MIEVTFLGGVGDGIGYDRRCILYGEVWWSGRFS